MAVKRYAPINIAGVALAAHPVHFVADTTAELPSSGLKLGDTAVALDTNIFYKAASTTTWMALSGVETFTKSAVFALTPSALTVVSWIAPFACTMTALKGYRIAGTGATINAYRGTTATACRSANLSLTSADTWFDGGTLQNTAFAATNSLLLGLVSVTGAPTQVAIQAEFSRP